MATTVPMASSRQPFAPLDNARLQNLTSLKNRQNALPLSPPGKRKAAIYEDDAENIDPTIYSSPKKSKGLDGLSPSKPSHFILTRAPASPDLSNPLKLSFSAISRTTTTPRPLRSPISKLNPSKSTPMTMPAGRSPTRKRTGILNRRKTISPFTRVDPPRFSTSASSPAICAPFSLDAALSNTMPSYGPTRKASTTARPQAPQTSSQSPNDAYPSGKDSWYFTIHEDTPDELLTNLMEHSTCTLDLSSDEESTMRLRNSRGKENVPPPDDASQTRLPSLNISSTSNSSSVPTMNGSYSAPTLGAVRTKSSRSTRKAKELGAIEIDRKPLGDLAAEDFYGEGCDATSVFVIHDDEKDEPETSNTANIMQEAAGTTGHTEVAEKANAKENHKRNNVGELMAQNTKEAGSAAAKLCPIEKAEDGWTVWESGSAKGDE